MTINNAGLSLLKEFEHCELHAYQDNHDVWTIGWGATGPSIHEGMAPWTQEEADARLCADLYKFETGVSNLLKVDVTPNEFSALVCLAYNIGLGALKGSQLLKYVNARYFKAAAAEFLRWDKIEGKMVPGLERRRMAECMLFLKT